MITSWNLQDAVTLCRDIEKIAPLYGAHIALTGGTLLDVDIVFYRIRQVEKIETEKLFGGLRTLGIEIFDDHGFCVKAALGPKPIDIFFPERPREEWPEEMLSEYE